MSDLVFKNRMIERMAAIAKLDALAWYESILKELEDNHPTTFKAFNEVVGPDDCLWNVYNAFPGGSPEQVEAVLTALAEIE